MGLFKKIKAAKASVDAVYQKPGHYFERVDRIKTGETRKDRDFVVWEKTCIQALTADSESKPGDRVSDMLMCDLEVFLPRIKGFMINTLDCEDEEIEEEHCEQLISDDQPCEGMVVEVIAKNGESKAGKTYTRVTYVRSLTPDEIEETFSEEEIEAYKLGTGNFYEED